MANNILTKVEKAQLKMKGIPTADDIKTMQTAIEEMSELEEMVGKLTGKQLAKIQRVYGVNVINTLESLKISVKHNYAIRAAMQYKSLKSVL